MLHKQMRVNALQSCPVITFFGTEYAFFITSSVCLQRQLRGHQHIIQLVAAAGNPPSQTSHGNAEFIILTELCPG